MAERPSIRLYALTLIWAAMNNVRFACTPANVEQGRGLRPGEPTVPSLTFGRQNNTYDAARVALSGVMVERGPQILKVVKLSGYGMRICNVTAEGHTTLFRARGLAALSAGLIVC